MRHVDGRTKVENAAWWWNEEVSEKIYEKRIKSEEWHRSKGTERERERGRENSAFLEHAVAKKKSRQWQRQSNKRILVKKYTKGQKLIFRAAKQMAKERQDVIGINCLREDGNVVVELQSVTRKWKE